MDRDLAAASQQRESSQRYEDGLGASPAAQPSPQRPILDVPEPDVPELMRDLFSKIGTLLEGELQGASARPPAPAAQLGVAALDLRVRCAAGGEDFTLLEQMNLLTTNKYRSASSSGTSSSGVWL